jgi:hypothetical protein
MVRTKITTILVEGGDFKHQKLVKPRTRMSDGHEKQKIANIFDLVIWRVRVNIEY